MTKHRIARGARRATLAAISLVLVFSTQSRPFALSTNWTTGGPDGGSVSALATDPANPDVLYAGILGGGVWKSVDGGETWGQSGPIDDQFVSQLAIVPGSPQTVFAATFLQLYKTTNGGLTWTFVNMGVSKAIRDLDIDPLSPNAIYVVLQNTGVRRSMDGGVTWDWLPGPSGLAFIGTFAVDPTNSNTLYAAHSQTLFKSVDRGVTWTETNLQNSAPSRTLAVDPLNPSTLYGSDANGILRKSVNGGTTWQAVLPQSADIQCVLVDADNPGVVYAAGRGVFKSIDAGANWTTSNGLPGSFASACLLSSSSSQTLYTGWSGAGVYKTNDGAATWAPSSAGLRHTNITAVVAHPELAGIAYAAVGGGGVFKTVNSGGTWTPVNGGLTNWHVFGLGMDPQSPDTLYAATTTGIFKTIDGGISWVASNAGLGNTDVRYVAVDPVNPQNVYVTGFGGASKSSDAGATWGAMNNGLTQSAGLRIHIDPTNSEVVYAAGSPDFYRSDDGGANWIAISSGIGSFRDFAIDPLTPTTMYALGNTVLKSVDGGATWFASGAGIPSVGTGSIAIDPVNSNLVYVGMQSGRNVFVSTDRGTTWTQLPTFATRNVLALTVQRAGGSNVVYAGTDGGGVFTRHGADATPPQVLCAAADAAWHNSDVTISCTAVDAESGLANAGDTSFNLTTNVPAGTETASAATNSRQVCDVAGNCVTAGPVAGNKVDKKAPTITVTSPAANAPYQINAIVPAEYGCSDGASGVAVCQAPVPNAGSVDTSSTGTKTFAVTATDGAGNQANLSVQYGVVAPESAMWSMTGAMNTPRYAHASVLLSDGRVLVSGGDRGGPVVASAEIYNPIQGTWSPTGSMSTARYYHTSTLLQDGRVLVAGGGGGVASAEIFDPASGTWSPAASMSSPRSYHTSTRLRDGRVLIIGGADRFDRWASAEIYDPELGTWSPAGSMSTARYYHATTLLADGRLLVSGGIGSSGGLGSVEIYDPALGTWSVTGGMSTDRYIHTATPLPGGRVLVTGGGAATGIVSSAEIYDSVLGTWSATGSMSTARWAHTATELSAGRVLVSGGGDGEEMWDSAEIYDATRGTWSPLTTTMSTARYLHTATRLTGGRVLVTGGIGGSDWATAEIYSPDGTAPQVSCGTADVAWHNSDVIIACTASDPQSGLANAADASFTLTTNVQAGTETANAMTNSRQVCNTVGECTTVSPIADNKVDKKAPTITLNAPVNGATYVKGQLLTASYNCSDGGSGVATCAGTLSNGGQIDTSTIGTKTFTVDATDEVGHASSQTVTYTIVRNASGGTSADLAISITSDAPNRGVASGGILTYTVTVVNKGPDAAQGILFGDQLPFGTTFISASATQGSVDTSTVSTDRIVRVSLPALNSTGTVTLTLTLVVDAAAGTTLTNGAGVQANTADPTSSNNTATLATRVR